MSFREQSAWAMMAILTVGGLWYFNKVRAASVALGETAPPIMPFVIAYIVLIVIASIVAMSVLGMASPEAANAPADERERQADSRAGDLSGYVLGAGVIIGLLHYPLHMDGNMLYHIGFASLMLSQIAEYGLRIWYYRTGS
ncbi:MAG: hypothetical protein QNI84_02660 [Henriciella sp.]|nr:hypothetical protein [Henriciella sp.]